MYQNRQFDLFASNVSDAVIEKFAANLKHLRRLNLEGCNKLSNASLQSWTAHRASTLQLLWLGGNTRVTGDAIDHLKSMVPALYVHWHLGIEPTRDVYRGSRDYALCTALTLYNPVREFRCLSVELKLLTVLRMYECKGFSAYALLLNAAALTQLIHNCPLLHTLIVSHVNSSAYKDIVSQTGRKITVTDSFATLFVDLQTFPVL